MLCLCQPCRFVQKFVKTPEGFKTDKDVVEKTMKLAGEYIDGGENLLLFPEGTLSQDGTLKEFKGSAFFNLAIEKQAPIVPMAMWGNQTLWLHGTYVLFPNRKLDCLTVLRVGKWTPQPGIY